MGLYQRFPAIHIVTNYNVLNMLNRFARQSRLMLANIRTICYYE